MMENAARKMEPPQPILEYGRVQAPDGDGFVVQTAYGFALAEKAVSCLLTPEEGDTVLVCVDGEAACFILAVLRREEGRRGRTELSFEGDVDLRVRGGSLALAAETEIGLTTDKVSLHAGRGEAVIERFSFVGRTLNSQVHRIRVTANKVEQVFRRLTQRLQDSFRFVKDLEEVQAGTARYLVEDTLTLHAKNANHMAEELVTIQAEQIHLG